MDRILSTLLSTPWGRSFIGWTSIASFLAMLAMGWAYLRLQDDCSEKDKARDAALERCWQERVLDMKAFHARQDSIEERLNNTKKKKR